MTAADARTSAARIVGRVVREGAYSNVVSRIETKGLNPSDAGVSRALAYDVLRHLDAIDEKIAAVSKRQLAAIDPQLLDLLRVGVSELGRRDRPQALTGSLPACCFFMLTIKARATPGPKSSFRTQLTEPTPPVRPCAATNRWR